MKKAKSNIQKSKIIFCMFISMRSIDSDSIQTR